MFIDEKQKHTTEEDQITRNRRAWIAELRAGHRQCRYGLHKIVSHWVFWTRDAYCALGLAAHTAGFALHNTHADPIDRVMGWLGVGVATTEEIYRMNDRGATFPQIADHFEKEWGL